jgi:hypothetical protein
MTTAPTPEEAPRFAIFRGKDSIDLDASGVMEHVAPSAAELEGIRQIADVDKMRGHYTRLLFSIPGFSLAYGWFKSGYPLPRHSHSTDCLYYIVGGSLKLGTEELKAGDGFFLGGGVPYTYTPGDKGVEVLEFRTANTFDIRLMASNPAFWAKAAETFREKRDVWPTETVSPSGITVLAE